MGAYCWKGSEMSIIWISDRYTEDLKRALAAGVHEIAPVRPCEAVSEPISMHADIFLCKLGTELKSPVFHGNADLLGAQYPADVLYNAVVTERFMICNIKTVCKDIIDATKYIYPDIKIINVKQGYTKCNMVVLDDSHFITEDAGIAKAIADLAEKEHLEGLECLLVRPGYVKLPGYDRGFIGGASGRIGNDIWFNGDISQHPDFDRIKAFIDKCGLGLRYLPGAELTDIGSIIEEYDIIY